MACDLTELGLLQMNAIYDFLTAKKKAMEAQAKLLEVGMDIKPKYEYDSDEEVEGGTWEHRKRMAEMEATKGLYIYPIISVLPPKRH